MSINKKLTMVCGAFAFSLATCVSADPLDLANEPLVIETIVDPNIMILFDTSGSMSDSNSGIFGDYKSAVDYSGDCGSSSTQLLRRTGTNSRNYQYYYYKADVDADGKVTILQKHDSSNFSSGTVSYEWGTSGSGKGCFNKNTSYRVVFTDHWGEFPNYYTVTGNFLNWYFSNADQSGPANFGEGNIQREGVGSRNSVAIKAMVGMVGEADDEDRLQNARVGIAGFQADGSEYDTSTHTARIFSPLMDINASDNRTALLDKIKAMPSAGYTPLATSLAALGRYFVQGHNDNLDVDGTGTPAYTLFDREPVYDNADYIPAANEIIQYSCQKNFIIAMTDGEPTAEYPFNDTLRKWEDGTSGGSGGDFDDVAASLFDLDLRPNVDETNNIITYPIGFAIDMELLEDAAELGGGKYFRAQNSESLISALNDIVTAIEADTGTVSSVAFNTGRLVTGTSIFQAKFNTDKWAGQLLSLPLNSVAPEDGDDADLGSVGSSATWEASVKLDAMEPDDRRIFTFNTASNEGVAFAWGNLSEDQQDDLAYGFETVEEAEEAEEAEEPVDNCKASDAVTAKDIRGTSVLNWFRGVRDCEESKGGNFRDRTSRLGDIVNSTPVYVGAPEMAWPDYSIDSRFGATGESNSYSKYKADNASRAPVVYVGANDGMLHGFDASNDADGGEEVFAYIPGAVYSTAAQKGLHYLADPEYIHRYYVDLTPAVSDVFIGNRPDDPLTTTVNEGAAAWRTVLIGGLRNGGKGLFALDVTNPSNFLSADNADEIVLWEFTSEDDIDFGYSFSQPTIAMLPNDRWAAIVGNGYNSTNENAYLFVLFLDGGLDGEWTEGTDYIKIPTDTRSSNGLSTPRVVDLDGDMVADRAYAGDLQGRMWAFDLSSEELFSEVEGELEGDTEEVLNWVVAHQTDSGEALPLFTARNEDGTQNQPITAAPILVKNSQAAPSSSASPNVLVLFGTGQFIEKSDPSRKELQTYYGIWDDGVASLTRASLVQRELITETKAVIDPEDSTKTVQMDFRKIDGNDPIPWETDPTDDVDGYYGWYLDLENKTSKDGTASLEGERVVADSMIRREVLLFNTVIPNNAPCGNGGSGWLMTLDYFTGGANSFAVFDHNNDGYINAEDQGYVGEEFLLGIPSQSGLISDYQYTPGSDGSISVREIEVGKSGKEGRLSWEELIRQ